MGLERLVPRLQGRLMRQHVRACHAAGRLRAARRAPEPPDARLLQHGADLCAQVCTRLLDARASHHERALLVTPPSLAGSVWFEDLRVALQHIGVPALRLADEQALTPELLASFRPTLLLGLETDRLLDRLAALGLDRPTACTRVLIPMRDTDWHGGALTAAEARRLARTASGAGADLLMSLHAEPFMQRAVAPWLALGKPYIWLPQAASPFRDRPANSVREFDYVHLSVANPQRIKAVWATLRGILARHHGLFGERETWGFGTPRMPIEAHALGFARARVSLAPLVEPLLSCAGELTQRVYAAAAGGAFQITELTPLTRQHFDEDELIAVPRAAHAMREAFERWIDDRPGRERVAWCALERVHREHTTLHRAVQFIDDVRARR